jgi:hypothetical protein
MDCHISPANGQLEHGGFRVHETQILGWYFLRKGQERLFAFTLDGLIKKPHAFDGCGRALTNPTPAPIQHIDGQVLYYLLAGRLFRRANSLSIYP